MRPASGLTLLQRTPLRYQAASTMILASNSLDNGGPRATADSSRDPFWLRSAGLLDELERSMRSATTVTGVLGEAGEYHLHGGGKRLRGRITLAAGLSLGLDPDDVLPAASAVELLHAASLVHDDLQDHDRMRRGREAVWSRYGKDTALLLGDTLIGAAFAEAARSPRSSAAEIALAMSRCIGRLAEGQRRDVAPAQPLAWTSHDYEVLARKKTGKLVALAAELPLIVANEPLPVRRGANHALEWIGVAYQIQDDLADLVGTKGRKRGSDIRTGKMSAVLIHHLGLVPSETRRALVQEIQSAQESGTSDLPERMDSILASTAVPACLLQQRAALRRAARCARSLPSELRRTLRELARRISEESFLLVQPALEQERMDARPINRLDELFEEERRAFGARTLSA